MKMSLFAIAALACMVACNSSQQNGTGTDSTATQPDSSTANASATNDWNIGLQLWTFRVFSFHDALKKADSLGIQHIQAFPDQDLGGSWKGKFGPSMTPEQRQAVKQYADSLGVTINSFGVTGADDLGGWKKLFDFAKDMNIPLIVAEPKDEQWGYVDSLAGAYGIRVAIHDHPKPNHYWSPDSVLAAIQGHPNLGACADIGHWARNGIKPVDALKKLEGHVWNVHFKDVATFDKTDAADTIPGKGVIDFPAVFQELKRQNYKGDFTIEHESNWYNNAGDVAEIVQFYKQQIANVK